MIEAEGYTVDYGARREPMNLVQAGCVALLEQCVDLVLVKRSICALLNLFHRWPWVSVPEEPPCRAKNAVLPLVTLIVLMRACQSVHCPNGPWQKILEPDGPPWISADLYVLLPHQEASDHLWGKHLWWLFLSNRPPFSSRRIALARPCVSRKLESVSFSLKWGHVCA